jgi:hypothetical protein
LQPAATASASSSATAAMGGVRVMRRRSMPAPRLSSRRTLAR